MKIKEALFWLGIAAGALLAAWQFWLMYQEIAK